MGVRKVTILGYIKVKQSPVKLNPKVSELSFSHDKLLV